MSAGLPRGVTARSSPPSEDFFELPRSAKLHRGPPKPLLRKPKLSNYSIKRPTDVRMMLRRSLAVVFDLLGMHDDHSNCSKHCSCRVRNCVRWRPGRGSRNEFL
jgi:hypothetical protein